MQMMNSLFDSEPLDPSLLNNILEQIEKERAEWDSKDAAEKRRIEQLACPVCKSTNKKHIVKSANNGVIGPGYCSYRTADYYVCNGCGVHFSDINKAKLGERPYESIRIKGL